MAWLAKLDARATRWPRPVRWSFFALKWYLVAGGAIIICAQAVNEIREGRIGLGTGVLTMVVFATIKGVLMAVQGTPPEEPPAH